MAVPADYPRLVALAQREGWNYSLEDFLDLDRSGCATTLVTPREGDAMAMVTMMDYGGTVWISNMLVDGGYRGRGVGAGLLREGIARMGTKRTVALFSYGDAVGFYLKQGFRLEGEYPVVRYAGGRRGSHGEGEPSLESVAEMDWQGFSTRRAGLLKVLAAKGKVLSPARGRGFAIVRPDPAEPTVGPVVCEDASAGRDLLLAAFQELGAKAIGVLVGEAGEGFEAVGKVSRLYLGEPPQTDTGVALTFAGLEFG